MEYLFIGYAVNRQLETKLKGVSVAGNKMQVNLLKCLFKELKQSLHAISVYPVAAYPSYPKVVIKRHETDIFTAKHNESNVVFNAVVPFLLNLPIIKNVFEIITTYCEAKRIYKKYHTDKILIFNAFPPTAYAALKLQKKYGCEVTCLLADLPIDDSVRTKGLKKILRHLMDDYTRKAIKRMDKLIVLNAEAGKLYAPDVPDIVIEGAVDITDICPFEYVSPKRKNYVFTGALQKYNGIVELIQAFEQINDPDIELDIYGRGEYTEFVTEASKRDNRIHYGGLKTNDEVIKIQKEAFILVNPRPVDDFIARVTFPSKIFEYMLSGTPVITTRLNGFASEYYDKMFFIEDNSIETLKASINFTKDLTSEELETMAESAYQFVTTWKNWPVQSSKILSFISTSL